jgi:hypothetical protein
MNVTAWKGGRFENPSIAYGIRIGPEDRSRYFQPEWETIIVEIAGGSVVEATLTAGFWQDCPEVRHPAFRDWFKSKRLIPWSAMENRIQEQRTAAAPVSDDLEDVPF